MYSINENKAIKAITLLKQGITTKDKAIILQAYTMIENDEAFFWDGLDDLFNQWDKLIDKANELLTI
ncbi:hypothetical protein [Sphingobacterium cellulitidis]|uniref:Uncharacterized protein n=1 Tax=Sphingobacterium cellulitidis TaxID=1768011 RepID=A0A8H9G4I1_9SPHI|nr:hypothetical protein [Sphingobacterium soli]MBA8985945.1 hypothetical protein [Sphingobacterium soli]GGE28370.1 hypothetical protein GCM10011516_27560 [Sphingobacterium soli]